MIRRAVPTVPAILSVVLPLSAAVANDFFVNPRISTQAGYEDNRLRVSANGEGAPFWQVAPGADFTVLGADTEASLFLDYLRTQYEGHDFEPKNEAYGFARWRHFGGRNEAGAAGGGGLYRDEAWPEDDHTFWDAKLYAIRALRNVPAELSLEGTFRQTFYDVSIYPSATDRADRRSEVRPGLRWHISYRVTIWAEVYAENNQSDAPEAEYSGIGGMTGFVYRPVPRLDLGAQAGGGTRPYAQDLDGTDRRDTPRSAGAWTSYRLRPWLELLFSVDWESCSSTTEDADYTWWRCGSGAKFVFERLIPGR